MTSERKAQSNRANGRNSTGPRTPRGKAHAARNARRLGLSLSVLADPVLSDQVAVLTREIAGEASDGHILELARRVAEAQIDLQRVRRVRHRFISTRLKSPGRVNPSPAPDPHELANILVQNFKEINAMDRYERRALSRRRFAIRALDVGRNFWQDEAN
jgi:hypothetical protein